MAVPPTARRPVVTGNGVAIGGAIVALAILGLSGIVLAWDGAWWITHTGQTGTPTFLHGRVAGWVTQAPALVVRWLGGDAMALTITFGLGFAAVILAALVASWRIVRPDRDALLVFPMLGIGVALLPGQALLISEAVMAAALAWPLVLAAALGRVGRHRWLVGATVLLLATLHPFAIPIFLIAAAISGLTAWRTTDPGERTTASRFALLLVLVAALVAGRFILAATPYEEGATSLDRLAQQFRGSVAGRPLLAIAGASILGAWLVWRPRRDPLGIVVVGLVVGAIIVVLGGWAADPARWDQALMFRTFALAVQLPLIACAVVAAWRPEPARPLAAIAAPACAGVMIVVAVLQALAWQGVMGDLRAALTSAPVGCVEAAGLLPPQSPLDHWGITSLVLVLEAEAPRHLVVADTACADVDATDGVPIKIVEGVTQDRAPADGWLDLRAIAGAMAATEQP